MYLEYLIENSMDLMTAKDLQKEIRQAVGREKINF